MGLELHDHRAEAAARAARLLAADEGARRLLVDERDDLHPRQPRRLRRRGATPTAPTGWGYDDVLPYFIRAEGNTRLGAPFHGQDGPLHVEDRALHPRADRRRGSSRGRRRASSRTDDFNGAEQEGAGLYQVTCRKGRRWSVADAYLDPALARAQPDRAHRRARRRGSWSRAAAPSASTYRAAAASTTAYADAEVVLSGGADQQPAAADALRHRPGAPTCASMGIDVVVDLPGVGQNLHDHPAAPLVWLHQRHHRPRGVPRPAATWSALEGDAAPGRWSPTSARAAAFFTQPRRPRRARPPGPRRADRLLRQRPARADARAA